ncbi:MAG: hypothetical protein JXR10_13685 [Cyclobacteriaceae bacterium]
MKNLLLFTLILTGVLQFANAQERATHYTDSTGNLYWRKSTPIYMFISDSPDGQQERLKSKITEQYADPFYLDTEGVNYIRSKNAVDPETMKMLPDTEVKFEIYADGLAPQSSIEYTQPLRLKDSGVSYYQKDLKVNLTSKDQMSGVLKINYQINGGVVQTYNQELVFSKAGKYDLSYFSEDRVGNVEDVQTVSFIIDPMVPFSNLTINGITEDGVISRGSKIYIIATDSLSGVKDVYFKFNDKAYQRYNGHDIPFTDLEEGDYVVTYYAVDRVLNEEEPKSFSFFLDKTAPLMVADVLGDRFIVGDDIYFSGRTKLKLTAVDNKVGVKEVMYSIDDEEFKPYTEPFYLPSLSGVHKIRYYSVDNLNNSTADSKKSNYLSKGGFEEFKHNVSKFYVDLNGPQMSHSVGNFSFVRSDTLFVGPSTKFSLKGTDVETGIQKLSYSLNADVGEVIYDGPFTLTSEYEGYNKLNYFGYDNVNNRNVSETGFYLDATPPDIFIQFNTGSTGSKGGLPVYPVTCGIFLSATDQTSGVSSVTYKLGKEDLRNYGGLITNMKKGKHILIVKAKDFLNNETTKTIEFYIK